MTIIFVGTIEKYESFKSKNASRMKCFLVRKDNIYQHLACLNHTNFCWEHNRFTTDKLIIDALDELPQRLIDRITHNADPKYALKMRIMNSYAAQAAEVIVYLYFHFINLYYYLKNMIL